MISKFKQLRYERLSSVPVHVSFLFACWLSSAFLNLIQNSRKLLLGNSFARNLIQNIYSMVVQFHKFQSFHRIVTFCVHAVDAFRWVRKATIDTERQHVQENHRYLHCQTREEILWTICSSDGLEVWWQSIVVVLQPGRRWWFRLPSWLNLWLQCVEAINRYCKCNIYVNSCVEWVSHVVSHLITSCDDHVLWRLCKEIDVCRYVSSFAAFAFY